MKNKTLVDSAAKLNFEKPFWELGLNPITMQESIPNHYDHHKVRGIKEHHITKSTNHFMKNYT